MDSENYKPNISVIIVTYNSNHVIHKCMDFLSKNLNDKIIEIVVIDNGSKDNRYLSKYDEKPGISIHKLKKILVLVLQIMLDTIKSLKILNTFCF